MSTTQAATRHVVFGTLGCYKPLDMWEMLNMEKENGLGAAIVLGRQKQAERVCVAFLYRKDDFDAAPAINGMRKVLGYPYPNHDMFEIMILYARFPRPLKQPMYIPETPRF